MKSDSQSSLLRTFEGYELFLNVLKLMVVRSHNVLLFQARIHTGFHGFTEIGQIFQKKNIFSGKWFG